jgi:hypothetical protein
MLSYDEALAIARGKKSKINKCTEFSNAYAFCFSDGTIKYGGDAPVVIMKDTGMALNFIDYAITPDKEVVREFDVHL